MGIDLDATFSGSTLTLILDQGFSAEELPGEHRKGCGILAFVRICPWQLFQRAEECNRSPLWGPFRVQLLQTQEELRVELAYEKMMDTGIWTVLELLSLPTARLAKEWGLENVTKVDEESKVCLLGLVSMQYYFAHMLLFEIGSCWASLN